MIGGAVVLLATVVVGMVVFSDDRGAPVPFELQGSECHRYGDRLAACPAQGGTRWFARDGDAWIPPSGCERGSDDDHVRCRHPFPLELDFSGDYPTLRRADD